MSRIIGIDPSLTRTAVAIIDTDRTYWEVRELPTSAPADATLNARDLRLERITSWVVEVACDALIDLAVIEGPAHSRTSGHHHDRSGLWWRIVDVLRIRAVPVAEVPPTSLKKYVAGRGNAGKDEVILAAARRYGEAFPAETNDGTDAFVLAAMGARHLGHPQEQSLPKTHLTAMEGVQWPC